MEIVMLAFMVTGVGLLAAILAGVMALYSKMGVAPGRMRPGPRKLKHPTPEE